MQGASKNGFGPLFYIRLHTLGGQVATQPLAAGEYVRNGRESGRASRGSGDWFPSSVFGIMVDTHSLLFQQTPKKWGGTHFSSCSLVGPVFKLVSRNLVMPKKHCVTGVKHNCLWRARKETPGLETHTERWVSFGACENLVCMASSGSSKNQGP